MCDLLIPGLIAVGALITLGGMSHDAGYVYTCPPATYAASYSYTPCAGACYVGGPVAASSYYAGSYTYYGGTAPTAAYQTGSQYYGYSAGYANGGHTAMSAGYTSPYASASTYYGY